VTYYKLPENIKDKIFVIDEDGSTYKYSVLIECKTILQKKTKSRSVVLVQVDSSVGAVMGLFSFLMNGQIPMLIDYNMDKAQIFSLIAQYKIEYFYTSAKNRFDIYANNEIFRCHDYILYETGITNQNIPNQELAMLLSTSGSTGSSKFVRLSYSNLKNNGLSIIEYLNISQRDRAITTLPLNYSYGFSIINSHVLAAATIILTKNSISERKFWDIFDQFGPTSLSGVPFTFEMLKKLKFFRKAPPHSLRYLTQAGGRMNLDLIDEISNYSKGHNLDFFVMYGQTEATARISFLSPKDTKSKLGSIGKAIPGGTLSIFPLESEEAQQDTDIGELVYSGPNVMMGYAESYKDLCRGDDLGGILRTGDIARVDKDGFYYLVGRLKRIIKIHGKRINLDEVENILSTEFQSVACSGIDDKLYVFKTKMSDSIGIEKYIFEKLKINSLAITIYDVEVIDRFENGKIDYKSLERLIDG
jgi:acyl-coenzyme A synthetase/AMP-(fatty) acid ligase